MNVPREGEERPVAWTAITEGTPAYSRDGREIGPVVEVLGAEDIFHGLVVRGGPEATDVEIPAEHVVTITTRRVLTDLSAEQVRNLQPYQDEQSFRLGITGLFRKHLGWVPDSGRTEDTP